MFVYREYQFLYVSRFYVDMSFVSFAHSRRLRMGSTSPLTPEWSTARRARESLLVDQEPTSFWQRMYIEEGRVSLLTIDMCVQGAPSPVC